MSNKLDKSNCLEMKSLVLLSFVFVHVCAIQWPFHNAGDKSIFNVTIGTPGQSVSFAMAMDLYNCHSLTVKKGNGVGEFNPKLSSTFNKTDDYLDRYDLPIGVIGTDNLIIEDRNGKQQKLTQKTFTVGDSTKTYCGALPTLSLAYTTDRSSNDFLDSVLAEQKQKTVTVLLDRQVKAVPRSPNASYAGQLYIGEDPKECSPQWNTFSDNSYFKGYQWVFQTDKFSVGKFTSIYQERASFQLEGPYFYLSDNVYYQVINELDVSGGRVACDSTTELVISVNGFDLHIKPEDYMDLSKPVKGECEFFGKKSSVYSTYGLPIQLLDRFCLRFDYENKEIGLSSKN